MRILLIILMFLISINAVNALEVVYPKKTLVNLDSPSTFFIGNTDPNDFLTINGKKVYVHPSGGFAHFVNLHVGQNNFVIKTEKEEKNFIINSIRKPQITKRVNFIKYEKEKYIITKNNNTPLRSTPVDEGINRLSHFQKGITLIADGEQNGFYRVILNDLNYAFVAKYNVHEVEPIEFATIGEYKKIRDKEFEIFEFEIDKKVPFTIEEGEDLVLKFYNVKNCEDGTFVFSYPMKNNYIGYWGNYEECKFVLKIRKFPKIDKDQPLKNITITIDAGHGGKERGAIGCLGESEKDLNLKIAKYLQNELIVRGANVVMTREEDVDLSLSKRVEISNNAHSMVFLSLHNNALPDTIDPMTRRGSGVYYYYDQSKELADLILWYLNEELGTKNDGIHQQSFAVVRNTASLAVLIEFLYMINPFDDATLINEEFQQQSAKAVADALEDYFCKKRHHH